MLVIGLQTMQDFKVMSVWAGETPVWAVSDSVCEWIQTQIMGSNPGERGSARSS